MRLSQEIIWYNGIQIIKVTWSCFEAVMLFPVKT